MTNEQKTKKLLSLKIGCEVEIDGVTYARFDYDPGEDEWKASPHGSEGDYDKDCYWLVAEELATEIEGLSRGQQ